MNLKSEILKPKSDIPSLKFGIWNMISRDLARAALAALALALVCAPFTLAQDQRPDATQMVLECMKLSNADGEITMLWWVPEEFWKVSAASNPRITPAQVETMLKATHPYTIVGVSSGRSRAGAVAYRTEPEVRDMIRLKDRKGNSYSPLPDSQLDPSVPGLFAVLKPSMAKTGGALAQNIFFYAFPGTAKNGVRICDTVKEGFCEVDVGARQFRWRTPLGSLLPKQKCPTCGEMLSGAYKYCPYDGTKLKGNK